MKFTITDEQLAQIVLKAQDIHEASYVRGEPYTVMEMTLHHGEYKKDHMVSAIEACAEVLGEEHPENGLPYVVHLLNYSVWNDIQLWAQDVLGLPHYGDTDETESDLHSDTDG